MSNTLDNSDYVRQIVLYANRIILEKKISITDKFVSGIKKYSINFLQPEWFIELDDDLKYNIITYLQSHYNDILKNEILKYNVNNFNDYQDNTNIYFNDKKRKLSEI